MKDIISLIVENRAWIFEGIGVVILVGLVGWLFKRRSAASQSQIAGDNSVNIQVGRNLRVDNKKK